MVSIILLSFLFGSTMKIADLLDEHGLRLFRYANIVFGIAYGIAGSLLFLRDPFLPSLLLALMIQWILRFRVDHLNHGIAFALFLVYSFYSKEFFIMDWTLFSFVFLNHAIHGLANDRIDKNRTEKNVVAKYFKSNAYMFWESLVLFFISPIYVVSALSNLIIFLSYRLTDVVGSKRIVQEIITLEKSL